MPKKTYLRLTLKTECANLSEHEIWLVPTMGNYDFVYEWEKENIEKVQNINTIGEK